MKKSRLFIVCILVSCLFLLPSSAFAVAGGHGGGSGGGGGHSSGGGGGFSSGGGFHRTGTYGTPRGTSRRSHRSDPLTSLLSFVALGAFAGLTPLKRKHDQYLARKGFLETLPGSKREKEQLYQQIEQAFFAIQGAWEEESPYLAKTYMTEKLLTEHQRVLAENKTANERNHTEKIKLLTISNYRSISDTSFSVRLDFKCVDYTLDRHDGRLLSGSKNRALYYSQTWYFNYDEKVQDWQADFIQPIYL